MYSNIIKNTKKNIWLVNISESRPFERQRHRRMRILANYLSARSLNITFWGTTFDHESKQFTANGYKETQISDRVLYKQLHTPFGYQSNVSIFRLLNHARVAAAFERLASVEMPPDLVVASYPTIELAEVASRLCLHWRIPSIIDIRDTWPDSFEPYFPRFLRSGGLYRMLLKRWFVKKESAMRNATSLTAVSEAYLKWGLAAAGRARTKSDLVFHLGYQNRIGQGLSRDQVRSALKIPDQHVVVWFSGTLGKTCDVNTVIDAIRKVKSEKESAPKILLVISGAGECLQELRNSCSDLYNVRFTGWLDSVDLGKWAVAADFGLMAYCDKAPQGLPNKLFEYMAHGLPIISCLAGESKSLILKSDIGLSYTAGDSSSLASLFARLGQLDSWIAGARQRCQLLFNTRYEENLVYLNFTEFIIETAMVGRLRT